MGHKKPISHADQSILPTPQRQELDGLSDDDLAAYAQSLFKLIDIVSETITKRGVDSLNEKANAPAGHVATLSVEQLLEKYNFKDLGDEKSHIPVYRKREDLPHPDRAPQAEANRRLQKLNPRISPEHIDLFNKVSEGYFTKREALEKAIELLASVTPENE